MTAPKNLKEASMVSVIRNHKAEAEFITLKNPAQLIYRCVIFVAKHTPILEIVPDTYPEQFFNREMEGGFSGYKKYCEKFYSQLEEEYVIPNFSWNVNDMFHTNVARVTDDFVDIKYDSGWRFIRVPRENIVILTPEDTITYHNNTISLYETKCYSGK